LHTPSIDEGAAADEKCVRAVSREGRKGFTNFSGSAGVEDLNLHPDVASGHLNISQSGLCNRCMGRIDQHGNSHSPRHQLTQKSKPLCCQISGEKVDTRQVATRPGKASDEPIPHGVAAGVEDDSDCPGGGFGYQCRRGIHSDDDCHLSANQIDR
jgi:hypothetical protein